MSANVIPADNYVPPLQMLVFGVTIPSCRKSASGSPVLARLKSSNVSCLSMLTRLGMTQMPLSMRYFDVAIRYNLRIVS